MDMRKFEIFSITHNITFLALKYKEHAKQTTATKKLSVEDFYEKLKKENMHRGARTAYNKGFVFYGDSPGMNGIKVKWAEEEYFASYKAVIGENNSFLKHEEIPARNRACLVETPENIYQKYLDSALEATQAKDLIRKSMEIRANFLDEKVKAYSEKYIYIGGD